jgi:hypothetical protein
LSLEPIICLSVLESGVHAPFNLDLDVDISASRVRIGTDFFMRFPGERAQFCLREALLKFHRKTKSAAVARTDTDICGDTSFVELAT